MICIYGEKNSSFYNRRFKENRNNKSILETLVSDNTTIHSFTKQQISSMLDQTVKDIDRFERDAENHKKETEKLKKELERYHKRERFIAG